MAHGNLCDSPRLGFTEAYVLIAGIIMAITLYIICSFIFYLKQEPITRVSKKKGPTKFLRNTGLIFFITILITFTLLVWGTYSLCTHGDNHESYEDLVSLSFSLEANVLLLVWFASIYHVLISSPFKLNRYTLLIYIASFTIHFAGAVANLAITNHQEIEDLITFINIVVYLFQLIMLLILYPVKLFKIYAQDKEFQKQFEGKEWLNKKEKAKKARQDRIVTLVTRLCILFYVQIGTSLISFFIVILLGLDEVWQEFVVNMVLLLDIFKCFICVLLTYSFYDRFYYKFCGSCHHRMVPCISRCSFCCIMLPSTKKKDNRARDRITSRTDNFNSTETLEINNNNNTKSGGTKSLSPVDSDYGTPTPEPNNTITTKMTRFNKGSKQISVERVPDDTVTKTIYKSTMTGNELVVRTNSNNLVNDLVPIDSDVDVPSGDEDSKFSGFNITNNSINNNHTPILILRDENDSNNVSKFSGNGSEQRQYNDDVIRTDSYKTLNVQHMHKNSNAGSESTAMTIEDRSSGADDHDGGNNSNGGDSTNDDDNYYKNNDNNDNDANLKKLGIGLVANKNSNNISSQQQSSFIMMPIMSEDASGEEYGIGSNIGTQTAQMEEILSGILDYSGADEDNFSKYQPPTNLFGAQSNRFSRRTSGNNTDNEHEESEVP